MCKWWEAEQVDMTAAHWEVEAAVTVVAVREGAREALAVAREAEG